MGRWPAIRDPAMRYVLAAIWLVNGLWCMVLGEVPRHDEIVGAILGRAIASPKTMAIGIAEVGMAVWIISGWRYRVCAVTQTTVILLMNLIEFAVVPHLLLWGRWNMIFALLLGVFILVNAFPRFPRTHA